MHDAFLNGGGDIKFVMFDPIGQDGHTLFSSGAGRFRWLELRHTDPDGRIADG
jgi:hypothetical protein